MYRRGDRRSEPELLKELIRRITTLEHSASRKILPEGYIFSVESGELVIIRETDGATSAGIV